MASFFRGPFSTFIRGAQTTIHEYQMMAQSLRQTLILTLLIVIGFGGWQAWVETTSYERYILGQWFVAGVKVATGGRDAVFIFRDEDGTKILLYANKYTRSALVKNTIGKAVAGGIKGGLVGISFGAFITLAVLLFFYVKGRQQTRDFYIRGARLGAASDLIRLFRKRGKRGIISLGGIRIPAEMEPTGVILVGAPKVGKSVQIKAILKEIRQAKKRAIVYDYGGNFTELFYREGTDFILNPTDRRSVEWRPWYDALEPAHYDQQAASLIPESTGGDTFWPTAARTVYVALARKLARDHEQPTLQQLLYWGLQSNADDVVKFLKKTEASAAFSKDKTASSIMSHLASYLKSFNYLPTDGKPFSIRKWIADEEGEDWLFISTKADQIDALRPLISMWVDIATSAILSMTPKYDRRIFCVFDEIPTLNVLPSLLTTLTNAAKYGGCGILGYQSHTLLKKVYGEEAAEAITGACAIHCIYRAQDVVTAKWAQEDLGETETAETNEGISYGLSQIRDGRSTNIQRSTRPLILASQVRDLKNLQLFLNAGSGLPVVPLQLRYVKHPVIASSFTPRKGQTMIIDHVLKEPGEPSDPVNEETPERETEGKNSFPLETEHSDLPLFDSGEKQNCDKKTEPTSASSKKRPDKFPDVAASIQERLPFGMPGEEKKQLAKAGKSRKA